MQREACNGAPVTVVATAVSRNSINSLLVKAKGNHIFTRMIEIKPPNQVYKFVDDFLYFNLSLL